MPKKTEPAKGKRQEFREMRKKRQRRSRIITVTVIVFAALLLVLIIAGPSIQRALAPVGEIVSITPVPRPQADDNTAGDPNAPVVIEEFSDFQCPYCKYFSEQTEPLVMENYVQTGKVYFIYRSMGEWIGSESVDAAEAAYCAGEQNKFWEYHDMLFANWQGENVGSFTPKRLQAFGENLGLDMDAFDACLKAGEQKDRVFQDRVAGENYNVTGTPAFIINGQLAKVNPQSYESFQQAIDEALAASGQ